MRRSHPLALSLAVGLAALLSVPLAGHPDVPGQAGARADLKGPAGEDLGTVQFTETPSGVLVHLQLRNVTPGTHAFHLHQTGRCEAPSFESAGGHFNPTNAEHGFKDASGPHAGDLPNVHVPPSGALEIEVLAGDVRLGEGENSLFDADGSAVVLHRGADDYMTDPAGDAGTRIACGVVTQ